jgi:hypothetical protein
MNLTLCICFGTSENPLGVSLTIRRHDDDILRLGSITKFNLTDDEGPEPVLAEVMYNGLDDDGDPISFLYAGPELPDAETLAMFDDAEWNRMSDEEAQDILDNIIAHAAPNASLHEAILFAGDPSGGDPAHPMQAWRRVFSPDDPLIPMFGQRIVMDPLDAVGDDDEEDLDDEEELTPDEEAQLDYELEVDPTRVGTLYHDENLLPVAIIYAAKVAPGEAQVAMWTKSLQPVSGFDLVAAGWEMLDLTSEELIEFNVTERIRLALSTHIDVAYDEEDVPYLVDFDIDNAENITDKQIEFLPAILREQVFAARELDHIDDFIDSWKTGDQDSNE